MPVTEAELAARVELSRDRIREVRRVLRLVSTQDWSSGANGIVYRDAAAEAILAYLAGQAGQNFSSASPFVDSPPPPAIAELSVKRLLPSDARLLAEFEGRQIVVRVRPGMAARFTVGMKIKAAANDGALWDYRGPYPRSRGRW